MKPPHYKGIRMACCMACRPSPASQGQGRTHGVALCRGFSSCSWQRTSNPYSIPTTLLLSAQSAAMAKGHPPSLVKAADCDQPHTRGMHAQQGTRRSEEWQVSSSNGNAASTYIFSTWRWGRRTTRTASSGCGSRGRRTASTACATCCAAYRSWRCLSSEHRGMQNTMLRQVLCT